MRIPCRIYLHVKLWVLQHRFQNEVLRVLEEETTKPSVQNPCFLFKAHFASSWIQTQAHGGKKCHQNPEENGQNWLLGKRQRSAVTLFWTFWKLSQVRCKWNFVLLPSIREARRFSSHEGKVSGCWAWRMLRCLDLPLSKRAVRVGEGGGGLLGHRGLLRHRRPMALSGIVCAVLLPHHQVCLSPRTMKKLKVYFCKKCVWETPSLLPEKPTFHVPHLSHGGFEHLKHFCLV